MTDKRCGFCRLTAGKVVFFQGVDMHSTPIECVTELRQEGKRLRAALAERTRELDERTEAARVLYRQASLLVSFRADRWTDQWPWLKDETPAT